jgi:Tfp pilus assembly protein PilN
MPKNKSINLLPQEEFDVSILGRALKWAMGTFRIIVIATEMVVMAAFLSRFWLDAQNSDLNNAIKIKTAQIVAQAATETEFRSVQSKLSIAKQTASASPYSQKVDLITSKVPPDVNLMSASVLENSAQVKGVSATELGIAQFVANLKAEPSFKNVDLGQINSSETNSAQTVFSVIISY